MKSVFVCSVCSHEESRWAGKCPSCGNWNTMEEQVQKDEPAGRRRKDPGIGSASQGLEALPTLDQVDPATVQRIPTGLSELDVVLGGGIVPGSFQLIAGEPGVGKSTLLLEVARYSEQEVLYISGEESPGQIRLRAERMGIPLNKVRISRQTDLDDILARIEKERPAIAIIDSIQTVTSRPSSSAPGSPAQLKEAALYFMEACKRTQSALLVTGHITREGTVAGPRILEHMVDVVLYFESDRLNHYRLLRAVKNRFGAVGEIAVFEMVYTGLRQITEYHSEIHNSEPASGRIFTAIREGSRAIAVEVQALVVRAAFGQTRRVADGLDSRRLTLIAAVLEKFLKLNLSEYDIFANLAGGLTASETSVDLAMAAAILSSYREHPADPRSAFIGEVGLTGEVRPVGGLDRRIKELQELGFVRFVIPAAGESEFRNQNPELTGTLDLVGISSVEELGAL